MPLSFAHSKNRNFNLAAEIVKAVFPDYLESVDGAISEDLSLPAFIKGTYTRGSVDSPSGAEIKIKPINDTAFTSPNVIDTVMTMLHEIHHARSDTPIGRSNSRTGVMDLGDLRIGASQGIPQATDAFNTLLATLSQYNRIPSQDINRPFTSAQEFLAAAIPELDAQERNFPKTDQTESVYTVIQTSKKVNDWVQRNKMPERQSMMPPSESEGLFAFQKFRGVEITPDDVINFSSHPSIKEAVSFFKSLGRPTK